MKILLFIGSVLGSVLLFFGCSTKSEVGKYVQDYPEILWLADGAVCKTEEDIGTFQGSYSQQLFGEKYIEFDRTVQSIISLKQILDGSDEAYRKFVESQAEETRLTRKSFQELHLDGKKLLSSKWGGLSDHEIKVALETAIVLGDMGKSSKAKELFRAHGVASSDHDDFYGEAIKVLVQDPHLSPSFARLSLGARELLVKIANVAHYGHITHLEGGPKMFHKLKESRLPLEDPTALCFDLLVHTCDVAGAGGQSSATYTESTHHIIQAMKDSVMMLSNHSELDAYNHYLGVRAASLGLDVKNPFDRVLTRIGAMLRLSTLEEGAKLQQAALNVDPEWKGKILLFFDIQTQSGRTPTYMPALLINISKNFGLSNALTFGLPFIVKALEEHKELVAKGNIDPNIPLNFNQAAKISKSTPNMLDKAFSIDNEGNVCFKKS